MPADAPGINIPASAMPGSAPTLLLDSELAISASAPDGQGEPLLTSYAGGLYRFAGR